MGARSQRGVLAALVAGVVAVASATVVALLLPSGPDSSAPPQTPPTGPTALPAHPSGPTTFRVTSFNILSAFHTSPRGTRPRMESGEVRTGHLLRLLEDHAIDVAGLQEVHGRQYAELERLGGSVWHGYPGLKLRSEDTHNSIVWRAAVWEVDEERTIAVPYFRGKEVRAPYVLLRHRETGQRVWFANFHNPADGRFRGNHARWRERATELQIRLANDLRSSSPAEGVPLVLTGDMNEREAYFCRLTTNTAMQAANGGSSGARGCRPPEESRIDWIFGSTELRFDGYRVVRSPLVERASDHPMIISDVTVPAPSRVSGGA